MIIIEWNFSYLHKFWWWYVWMTIIFAHSLCDIKLKKWSSSILLDIFYKMIIFWIQFPMQSPWMNLDGLKRRLEKLTELYVSQNCKALELVDHVITISSTKRKRVVGSNYGRIQSTKIFVEFASNVQFWPWIGHIWKSKSSDPIRKMLLRNVCKCK